VTLLMNPMALRVGLLLFAAIAAFGLGSFTIRLLRKNLESESEALNSSPLAAEGLPMHPGCNHKFLIFAMAGRDQNRGLAKG
jgi:hypothetical protein